MITGFNTDVKHGGKVFHIQTEDRGLANPVVESLVYVGGEILLSKKSPYDKHILDGKVDESLVRQMMDLQHRRIIEAIRRGRFDGPRPGAAVPGADGQEETPGEAPPVAPPAPLSPAAAAATAAILSRNSGIFAAIPPSRPPMTPPANSSPLGIKAPVQMVPPPSTEARSLDQVIMDYLASEAASEHLVLSVVKGGEIVAGEAVALSIRAVTSLTERPVGNAQVSVRIVSTAGPPQILYRGTTGNDGLVKLTCHIPEIGPANAALIIAATSPLGSNEVKHLVRKKPR
ncbi:MAG: hypothetical protein DIJKHBIC_01080 [Thermoanaerobaculia bacterium]|nr:hypothetical protein [Thermoanaerobaculia bacterium]